MYRSILYSANAPMNNTSPLTTGSALVPPPHFLSGRNPNYFSIFIGKITCSAPPLFCAPLPTFKFSLMSYSMINTIYNAGSREAPLFNPVTTKH